MTSTMSDSITTLIRGGQVHDGTGAPPQQLDVRIDDREILEVGKDLPSNGNDVFDASGLIVAPNAMTTTRTAVVRSITLRSSTHT